MASSAQQHDDNLLIIAYESEKIEVRAMVLKTRLKQGEHAQNNDDVGECYKIGYRNKFTQSKV